jgi:hypothetical protein
MRREGQDSPLAGLVEGKCGVVSRRRRKGRKKSLEKSRGIFSSVSEKGQDKTRLDDG